MTNSLFREHFRHLLFNDVMVTHWAGMNHNAMDRSSVYDNFLDDVRGTHFEQRHLEELRRCQERRAGFDLAECGYWQSLEQVDQYVTEITDKAFDWLLKKINDVVPEQKPSDDLSQKEPSNDIDEDFFLKMIVQEKIP